MKLTLEHLAPYLPYGLKIKSKSTIWDITNISKSSVAKLERRNGYKLHDAAWLLEDTQYKPLLRPLSDLTKEIEHNGEIVIGADHLSDIDLTWYEEGYDLCKIVDYSAFTDLLRLHFDVFGLIEKGLAIDLNTIQP